MIRFLITERSFIEIQNLVVNHESKPINQTLKVEALDESSVRLKNETVVSFGNLSPCLVPSA